MSTLLARDYPKLWDAIILGKAICISCNYRIGQFMKLLSIRPYLTQGSCTSYFMKTPYVAYLPFFKFCPTPFLLILYCYLVSLSEFVISPHPIRYFA